MPLGRGVHVSPSSKRTSNTVDEETGADSDLNDDHRSMVIDDPVRRIEELFHPDECRTPDGGDGEQAQRRLSLRRHRSMPCS